MGKSTFKLFFGIENQEKWLNEMAKSGKTLKSVELAFFEFEDKDPGNIIYRVDPAPGLKLKKHHQQINIALYDKASMEIVDNVTDVIYLKQDAKYNEEGYQKYIDRHYDNIIKHYLLWLILWVIGIVLAWNFSEDPSFPLQGSANTVFFFVLYVIFAYGCFYCIVNGIRAFLKRPKFW